MKNILPCFQVLSFRFRKQASKNVADKTYWKMLCDSLATVG